MVIDSQNYVATAYSGAYRSALHILNQYSASDSKLVALIRS